MCAIDYILDDIKNGLCKKKNNPYENSIWSFFSEQTSRVKGKFGEDFASATYSEMLRYEVPGCFGLVKSTGNTYSDINVWDTLIEVKTSFLWSSSCFKFQQIRDQKYSYAFLLGLLPNNSTMCWLVPKDIIRAHATGQHGGKDSDIMWLSIDPNNVPDWLKEYGGVWNTSTTKIPQKSLRKKLLLPFEDNIQKSRLNQISHPFKIKISRSSLRKRHQRSRIA